MSNKASVKKEYQKDKVRQLREQLGLRRTEFGAKIGYTYQQINRVEEGILPISEEMADKISTEYGVSKEWLSGKEGADAPVFEDTARNGGKDCGWHTRKAGTASVNLPGGHTHRLHF